MAVTISNVFAGGGAPSGGVSTTASWTPDGTSQYILCIASYVSAGSVPPSITSVTGNGLTWTALATPVNGDNAGTDRTTQFMYAVPAGGSAGAITITWSTVPTRASWVLDKVAGAASGLGSGTLPQAAASGTSSAANPSATLGSALQSGSVSYAAADFESTVGTLGAGSGYTALGQDTTQSLTWIISEWNSAGSTTATATNTTTSNRHSIILIEVAQASGSTPIAVSDAGSSTEAASVASATPLTETASASDSTTVAATTALGETGAGTEASTVAATAALGDAGAATEALSVDTGATAKALAEAGTAGETLAVTVALPLGDTASAAPSLGALVTLALAETAAQAETLGAAATITLPESGAATQSLATVTGSGNPMLGDSGTAADTLCVVLSRPATGVTLRPGTGTTARPASGLTARPDTGVTARPDTGTTPSC